MTMAMFMPSGPTVAMIVAAVCSTAAADQFVSAWPRDIERTWIGPEYYADRLQDWRIRERSERTFFSRPRVSFMI